MNASHPLVKIAGGCSLIEDLATRFKARGISVWTSLIRKSITLLSKLSHEVQTEMLQIESLINEYAKDGKFTEEERAHLVECVQEVAIEMKTGKIIPGLARK